MSYKKIHIGKLIQTFVKQNNINSAEFARKIGKTRQNVYDLYKRDDIEVKLFLTISDVLNHNFMKDLYPQENEDTNIDTIFDTLKKLVVEQMAK